jgi:hypothetical protein
MYDTIAPITPEALAFNSRSARLLRRIALAEACNLSARAEVYQAQLDGTAVSDPAHYEGLIQSMRAEEDGRNASANTARWAREVRNIDREGEF